MIWLVLGLVLWSGVHWVPSLGVSARAGLIERLGAQPYQGLFSLALVGAIVLMSLGWSASTPFSVYSPPAWGRGVALVLMFAALVLFAASAFASNFKRWLRHPQLSGVVVWAGAHLLANGDVRSLVLFGGLGVWALLAMQFINRRDGAWQKPEARPVIGEWKPVAVALVVYAALFFGAHSYLSGVPLWSP